MLANMACSLDTAQGVSTLPWPRAKALKVFVEPLITKSKEDTTHNRRIVFSRLHKQICRYGAFQKYFSKSSQPSRGIHSYH